MGPVLDIDPELAELKRIGARAVACTCGKNAVVRVNRAFVDKYKYSVECGAGCDRFAWAEHADIALLKWNTGELDS